MENKRLLAYYSNLDTIREQRQEFFWHMFSEHDVILSDDWWDAYMVYHYNIDVNITTLHEAYNAIGTY